MEQVVYFAFLYSFGPTDSSLLLYILGRPRHRREDNIKMDLREIGSEGVDWINWIQDKDKWPAIVDTVINLRVKLSAGNLLTS